jgi:hypothetical protein
MIVVVTDGDALPELERALVAHEAGFTVLPGVVGYGKTGVKAGDRVHPGSTSLLFTVVPKEAAPGTLDLLRSARDTAGARETTRIFVTAVESGD